MFAKRRTLKPFSRRPGTRPSVNWPFWTTVREFVVAIMLTPQVVNPMSRQTRCSLGPLKLFWCIIDYPYVHFNQHTWRLHTLYGIIFQHCWYVILVYCLDWGNGSHAILKSNICSCARFPQIWRLLPSFLFKYTLPMWGVIWLNIFFNTIHYVCNLRPLCACTFVEALRVPNYTSIIFFQLSLAPKNLLQVFSYIWSMNARFDYEWKGNKLGPRRHMEATTMLGNWREGVLRLERAKNDGASNPILHALPTPLQDAARVIEQYWRIVKLFWVNSRY